MTLIVDNRELKIINELTEMKIEFTTENLEVGDFLITDVSGNRFVIERKSIVDFRISLTGGRLDEQYLRIMETKGENEQVIYLLEGDTKELPIGIKKALTTKVVKMIKAGIIPVFTTDIKQSSYFVVKLKDYIGISKKSKEIVYETSLNISKCKKKNINRENIMEHQISLIPGFSITLAKAICEKYSSLKELILALETDKYCLMSIPMIGKKKCEVLYDFLC